MKPGVQIWNKIFVIPQAEFLNVTPKARIIKDKIINCTLLNFKFLFFEICCYENGKDKPPGGKNVFANYLIKDFQPDFVKKKKSLKIR